jgi:hypothetical protein
VTGNNARLRKQNLHCVFEHEVYQQLDLYEQSTIGEQVHKMKEMIFQKT